MAWKISERAADLAKPAVPLDPEKAKASSIQGKLDSLRKAAGTKS